MPTSLVGTSSKFFFPSPLASPCRPFSKKITSSDPRPDNLSRPPSSYLLIQSQPHSSHASGNSGRFLHGSSTSTPGPSSKAHTPPPSTPSRRHAVCNSLRSQSSSLQRSKSTPVSTSCQHLITRSMTRTHSSNPLSLSHSPTLPSTLTVRAGTSCTTPSTSTVRTGTSRTILANISPSRAFISRIT